VSDPYLGEITMFANQANWPPRGWALCDGTLQNIRQNTALFNLLGTTYGGDGQTTFALPKLEPYQGVKFYIATQGIFPSPA
jgi:microcystin-dependent protein